MKITVEEIENVRKAITRVVVVVRKALESNVPERLTTQTAVWQLEKFAEKLGQSRISI